MLFLWTVFGLFFFAAPASADTGITTLPEVVVAGDASKTVPSVGNATREARRVPGGAAVVDGEDLRGGRAVTPSEALGFVPGVYVQTRTGAEESRLSIRGSGLQRTFHLRGVLLLQDGFPLNEADGAGDFQKIEPLAARYTEVYRGGNATRFGASSLGGAVNFVSPSGHDADTLLARFEAGSFGYVRSQVSAAGVDGPFDHYVSASQFLQEGYRDHSGQDTYKIFANAGYRASDAVETRLYATFVESKSKVPGSLRKSQMAADPDQAAASTVTGNHRRNFNYWRVASKTVLERGADALEAGLFFFNLDLLHPIFRFFEHDSDTFGGSLRYLNETDVAGRANRFEAGVLPMRTEYKDEAYGNAGGERSSTRFIESDRTADHVALYAEDEFRVHERVAFTAAAALTYDGRDSTDYFLAEGNDSGRTVYRGFSPRAGAVVDVTDSLQAFGGYNRSHEPPSYGELFDAANNFVPNKAQTADTVELGSRGEAGVARWDVTFYHAWVGHELLSVNDAAGNPLGTVNSSSDTTHRGVELGASFEIAPGLVLRGAYDWSDLRFDDDAAYGDNRLPSLPEHFYRAELIYSHGSGFYAGPSVEGSLEEYPVDFANTFFADPYVVLGFRAGWRSKKGLSVFFEGKNVFDETYAASTGIVADARGADSNAVFNPGSGRAFFGGVEWRW